MFQNLTNLIEYSPYRTLIIVLIVVFFIAILSFLIIRFIFTDEDE